MLGVVCGEASGGYHLCLEEGLVDTELFSWGIVCIKIK